MSDETDPIEIARKAAQIEHATLNARNPSLGAAFLVANAHVLFAPPTPPPHVEPVDPLAEERAAAKATLAKLEAQNPALAASFRLGNARLLYRPQGK